VKAFGDENPSINYAYSMRFFIQCGFIENPCFSWDVSPFEQSIHGVPAEAAGCAVKAGT
jgi:hypothetical protein